MARRLWVHNMGQTAFELFIVTSLKGPSERKEHQKTTKKLARLWSLETQEKDALADMPSAVSR